MISRISTVNPTAKQPVQQKIQSFGSVADIGFTVKKFNYETQEFNFFRISDKIMLKSFCNSFIRRLKSPVKGQIELFKKFNNAIYYNFKDFNLFEAPHARSIDSKFSARRLILFGKEAQNMKDACVEIGVGFQKGYYMEHVRAIEDNLKLRIRDKIRGGFLCLDVILSENSKKKHDFDSLRIISSYDFLRVRPPQQPLLQNCSEYNRSIYN